MNLKRITSEEAKKLIAEEDYQLLDVRSMPEFNAEHAVGAFNVPYLHRAPHGMIANQDFSRVVQTVFPDKSTKIITSCQMGGRSVRAAAELANLGYTQVVDLRGGFGSERDDAGNVTVAGWKDAGLPVETGETTGRAYRELNKNANAVTGATETPKPPEAAHSHSHAGHDHSHGGHGHSHAPAPAAAPAANGGFNRFADPKLMVDCIKLNQRLPGIKRRPFPGPLGEKIRANISAQAWDMWSEHAKMIINEYRLNPSEPKAQEILMKQCEQFFWGDGLARPEGFVPESGTH